MKKVLAMIIVSGFLVAGLLVTPNVFAQASGQMLGATPTPEVKKGERHPAIRKALKEIRSAKQVLEKASQDFGGHRVAAIQAIDQAIGELEAALKSDQK